MRDVTRDEILTWTGESVIPELMARDPREMIAHAARYLFALDYCADKRVLDVACGCGYGAMILSWTARWVCGIDKSRKAIEYAAQHYATENSVFLQGDAYYIDHSTWRAGDFDVIVSFETIEHLDTPEVFLRSAQRKLPGGGLFIVSCPWNSGSIFHCSEMRAEELVALVSKRFTVETWFTQGPRMEFVEKGEPLWEHPTTIVVARRM